MANSIKPVVPGTAPYASDIDQFGRIFSGTADVGPLTMAPVQTAPSAPTVVVGAAGSLNGTYKYQLVAVTGWKENSGTIWASGFVPSAESTIAPANKVVTVTLPTLVAPVIAYLVYRTAAGGATGTEKFVGAISSGVNSFSDTVSDASLGTGMPTSWKGTAIPATVPTSNTTGTSFTVYDTHVKDTVRHVTATERDYWNGIGVNAYNSVADSNGVYTVVDYKRPNGTLFMKSTLSGGTSPNYTTVTWKYYDTAGSTVILTKTWTITYDVNGRQVSRVVA